MTGPRGAAAPDRDRLYERCVQDPPTTLALVRAIHGRSPRVLAEHFAGSAALSRAWVGSTPRGRAVAADLDASRLSRAEGDGRITRVRADLRRPFPRACIAADVIHAGNFSIGELHDRRGLVRYLSRCRRRLRPRGVFVCDTYGGASALRTGRFVRVVRGDAGERIAYTWDQREADPATAMVTCAIHFRVEARGRRPVVVRDAFVYRWRLWTPAELRDALIDAGFASAEFYDPGPGAIDQHGVAYARPIDGPPDADGFVLVVAGRS